MDNIRKFTSRDVIEEQASEWLVLLDGDQTPNAEKLAELKEWVNRSPAHREEIARLAGFWDNANILTELSIPLYYKQHPEGGSGLWGKVRARSPGLGWQGFGAVAALLIVAFMASFNIWESNSLRVAGNGIYETRIGEQNTITLADGSVIELNTNSNIQVDYTENLRLITLLQGEAHFEVSKDPDRPFEVYAGEGRVKAIGTAFDVRLQNRTLKVIVSEGKVSLAAVRVLLSGDDIGNLENKQGTIAELGSLEAGQTVVFDPREVTSIEEKVVILEEDKLERQLAWRGGYLLFSGEPLEEVVREINRYTLIHIVIVDPAIAQLRIGGQFKVGETDYMLQVLESNFNIGARIINADTIQLALKSSVR